MPAAEVCVIFNPASGKNRGRRRLEQLLAEWGAPVDLVPTTGAGHAVALAEEEARAGRAIVVAAGGDGTAHEVVNGLMRACCPDVRFALLPIGSANDYAHSLQLLRSARPDTLRVDVGRVRAPGERLRYFACNLGLGLGGAVTWEARQVRLLQGIALYGLATVRAICRHFQQPLMDIQIDDAPTWRTPTLMFSVLNGRREGGFVMAPQAQLDDGRLDFLHVGALSRLQMLRLLPRVALFGAPAAYAGVRQGQCWRIVLHSDESLRVHTDGEFFCQPEDGVHDLEIDVLPAALALAPELRF